MLAAIRVFAKSWVAAVLMGLLIVSFAIFGIHDVFKTKINDAVIVAGSRSMSASDFKREFDSYKARIEQQAGQPLTPEIINANGLDRRALDGLATREAFAALMTKIGIRPSDKLIAAEIQKIPAFFDQVSGRFDKQAYQQRLGENGLTPPKFEQEIRDQMAEQQVATGIVTGLEAPRAYTALAAIYGLESRDVSYFGIEPQSVPQPAAPTDAQLAAFMKENAAQLTRPEFRQLTVVRFSPADVAANAPVSEADVKKRFDFKKDTLSKPETRTIIQIPAKDQATAGQIAARLAKGEAADAIAKSLGVEAITYDNKPQSAVADHKVGAAAFGMTAGQIAPVQGDLGAAVVKIVAITPGKAVTLDEVRPAIEAEVRKDAAAEKVYALTQAYDDAHQGGASLAEAAKKAGVSTVALGPLSQQGRDQQGQPVPGLSQKLMETAWSLPAGGESEVEDAGGGEYFAVRVEKVIPPAMPSLEEVKPQLIRVWTMREVNKRMQARADELAARVRKGESLEAVAASAGSSVTHVPGLSRQTAGQNTALSQEMLGRTFNSKVGEVFTAQNSHFGYVVGKLDAIRAGDSTTLAHMTEGMRQQMSMAMFRELGDTAQAAARQKVKVTMDLNRARSAIGLDPLDAKGADAAKAGAKPEKAK